MQQSKFNFALVFAIMVLLAYSYITFLGLAYWQGGKLLLPVLMTLGLIAVVLGCIIMMCRSRATRWQKRGMIGQIVFGFIILVTLLAASLPFTNFVRVVEQQKKIQQSISQTCDQAVNLSRAYEDYAWDRRDKYEAVLKHACAGKTINPTRYNELVANASGATDDAKVNGLVKSLERRLMPDSASVIEKERIEWLKDASDASIWNPLTAANISEVDEKVKGWVVNYNELSSTIYNGEEAKPFEYDEFETSMSKLTKNYQEFHAPTVLAVLISLICFGIMLLPYLLTEVDVAAKADAAGNNFFNKQF